MAPAHQLLVFYPANPQRWMLESSALSQRMRRSIIPSHVLFSLPTGEMEGQIRTVTGGEEIMSNGHSSGTTGIPSISSIGTKMTTMIGTRYEYILFFDHQSFIYPISQFHFLPYSRGVSRTVVAKEDG